MKRIPLTRGQFALVDDDDFEWLSQWKWYALKSRTGFVAVRNSYDRATKKQFSVSMSRSIMQAQPGHQVDHVNHDTLDNRRENLRVCLPVQNRMNRRVFSNNSSGLKGIRRRGSDSCWEAKIGIAGKKIRLGRFPSAIEAARAYDAAALKHYGEFACTNASLGLL